MIFWPFFCLRKMASFLWHTFYSWNWYLNTFLGRVKGNASTKNWWLWFRLNETLHFFSFLPKSNLKWTQQTNGNSKTHIFFVMCLNRPSNSQSACHYVHISRGQKKLLNETLNWESTPFKTYKKRKKSFFDVHISRSHSTKLTSFLKSLTITAQTVSSISSDNSLTIKN